MHTFTHTHSCLPQDFSVLGSCTTLRQLYITSFVYDPQAAASVGLPAQGFAPGSANERFWVVHDADGPQRHAAGPGLALWPLLSLRRLEALEVREEAALCVRQRLAVQQEARRQARTPGPALGGSGTGALALMPAADGGSTPEQHREHLRAALAAAQREGQKLLPVPGPDEGSAGAGERNLVRFLQLLPPQLRGLSVQLLDGPGAEADKHNDWSRVMHAAQHADFFHGSQVAAPGTYTAVPRLGPTMSPISRPLRPLLFWRVALGGRVEGVGHLRPTGWPVEEGLMRG